MDGPTEDGEGRQHDDGEPVLRRYEGLLVRVVGLAGEVEAYEAGALRPAVDANGMTGRCLCWKTEEHTYTVQTFDGLLLDLAEENLEEFLPPGVEDGGFDVSWPQEVYEEEFFTGTIAECLARKGHCVVQMFTSKAAREEALQVSDSLEFRILEREIECAYLGEDNSSKVATLQGAPPVSESEGSLDLCDQAFVTVGQLLEPLSMTVLGFNCCGRSSTLVRVPNKDTSAPPLVRQDVEDGVVEGLLHFMKRRKVCMLYMLACANGGELRLHPHPGNGRGWKDVAIPLAESRLLLFRHDLMSYTYAPRGVNLSLQSWLYSEAMDLSFSHVAGGDIEDEQTIVGAVGPLKPAEPSPGVSSIAMKVAGRVDSMHQEWIMIVAGTDGLIPWPAERWETEPYYEPDEAMAMAMGKSYNNHGAFCDLDKFTLFSASFFEYTDEEAKGLGPEQRMALEVGYECFWKMGKSREKARGTPLGFVAAVYYNFWFANSPSWDSSRYQYSSSMQTAAIMSQFLGTTGPVHRVDTACSSSLVATCVADHDLRMNRDKDAATMVMAIMSQLDPLSWPGLCSMGMLSHKGRCFTYDASSDGFAKGEGSGALYLRWEGPEKERWASLAGSAINQDGRSASMTAPHGPSQREMTRICMQVAKITPSDLSVSETHGTGTALGDPIEVGALRAALDGYRGETNPILITTVKSNLSHMEANAGLSGVIKVTSMMRHGGVPGSIHLRDLNPHLDMDGFPWYIINEFADPARTDMYIGVQGFGMGGTNARADFWGRTSDSSRMPSTRTLKYEKADFTTVPCPRCLGPMCWLCGVAMPKYTRSPMGKHHCSLIREGAASYDFCSQCYVGDFMHGRPIEEPYSADVIVSIVGTWSAWSTFHEMTRVAPGMYVCAVALGETLQEEFHVVLNETPSWAFHPVIKHSPSHMRIEGPEDPEGKHWLIDGRSDGSSAGTVYEITFEWDGRTGVKAVDWSVATDEAPKRVIKSESYAHKYHVVGSWNSWSPHDIIMAPAEAEGEPYTIEASFRLGVHAAEEFQILRDGDWAQCFHPATALRGKVPTSSPIVGPDDAGSGKHFVAVGTSGETVTVRLTMEQSRYTLVVSTPSTKKLTWESAQDQHAYHIVGSHNEWAVGDVMKPDEVVSGVYRGLLAVSEYGTVEEFQILVDGDWAQTLHPVTPQALSGQGLLQVPDNRGEGLNWLVIGPPGSVWEVELDFNKEDRRQVVQWRRSAEGL